MVVRQGAPQRTLVMAAERSREAVVMVVHQPSEAPSVSLDTTGLVLFSNDTGRELVGTGFIYYADGRPCVITNRHLVEGWLTARNAGLVGWIDLLEVFYNDTITPTAISNVAENPTSTTIHQKDVDHKKSNFFLIVSHSLDV